MEALIQQFERLKHDPEALWAFASGPLLGKEPHHEDKLHYQLIKESIGQTRDVLWRAFVARGVVARNLCVADTQQKDADLALRGLALVAISPQSESRALEVARRRASSSSAELRALALAIIDDLVDGGSLSRRTRRICLEHVLGRALDSDLLWGPTVARPRAAHVAHCFDHQRYLYVIGQDGGQITFGSGLPTYEVCGHYEEAWIEIPTDTVAFLRERLLLLGRGSLARWNGSAATFGDGRGAVVRPGQKIASPQYLAGAIIATPSAPNMTALLSANDEVRIELIIEDMRPAESIPMCYASSTLHTTHPEARALSFPDARSLLVATSDGRLITYAIERDQQAVRRAERRDVLPRSAPPRPQAPAPGSASPWSGRPLSPPKPAPAPDLVERDVRSVGFGVRSIEHSSVNAPQQQQVLVGKTVFEWTNIAGRRWHLERDDLRDVALVNWRHGRCLGVVYGRGMALYDQKGRCIGGYGRDDACLIARYDHCDLESAAEYVVVLTESGMAYELREHDLLPMPDAPSLVKGACG